MKMKIDFIIGRMKSGGAERVVSLLANHLAENGNCVRIITFRAGDDYELHPSIERIRFHNKFIINSSIVKGFFLLLKFYFTKKNRPDVISSHIDLMGYSTIIPSKIYGIKLVVSEHFNHFNQKVTIPKWFLWNFMYRFPDAITILTKFDLSFFKNKNKNVVVMPNPCSFSPIGNINSTREKVILAVGNLNRYHHKGFDNLMNIVSETLKQNIDWKLKIVGDGDIGKSLLMNEAKRLGIENQIILTGFRADVKDIMASSEIFILSSRHEGLPMVLIEAVSQGMACISYDCISGPSDIIENNVNGILVSDQNIEEMTAKLNELVIDKNLRESLRIRTIGSLDKFSMENVGEKWTKLFHSFFVKK
jgi:glycosyltransferase involved in cell wall biosynthesis